MASCVLSEVRGLVKLRCSEDKRKRGDTREHKRVLGGVTVPYGTCGRDVGGVHTQRYTGVQYSIRLEWGEVCFVAVFVGA